MTTTAPGFGNFAGDNAWVNEQNTVIHGNVNINELGDTPEHKYRFALDLLDTGDAERARELIVQALEMGLPLSSKVAFNWVLSLLSGRALEELTESDLSALGRLFAQCGNDRWGHALNVIRRFFQHTVASSVGDGTDDATDELDSLTKEFEALPDEDRSAIRRHMDLLLDGAVEDRLHAKDREEVRLTRTAKRRSHRAWKFFHPDPKQPRVRPPRNPTASRSTVVRLGWSTTLAVTGLGWLVVVLAGRPAIATLAGCAALAGGWLCMRFGTRWIRIRDEWQMHHLRRLYRPSAAPASEPGFAKAVSRMFDRYARRYAPDEPHGSRWLAETEGLRRWLRDEIVEVYRESRTRAPEIAWLVRHRLHEVKRRWLKGRLWEYETRLRVPLTTRLAAFAGAVIAVAGFLWLSGIAVTIQPLPSLVATLLTLAGGIPAVTSLQRIRREHWRRYAEEHDNEQRLASDREAYQRWRAKLADRPDDREMATWLDADRRWLKEAAMRIYDLAPREVIAHSFLDGRAKACRRARSRSGPWRYSRYVLRVYLLTAAGVRQVTAELDFCTGHMAHPQRISFRYDTVATVEVTPTSDGEQKVRLMLINRELVDVKLTDEDPTELTLEDIGVLAPSSGLASTLRILEGIAAEGRDWVAQRQERRRRKLALLSAAE